MNKAQKVNKLNSGLWFSFFSQGFYFSVGFFALPQLNMRDTFGRMSLMAD